MGGGGECYLRYADRVFGGGGWWWGGGGGNTVFPRVLKRGGVLSGGGKQPFLERGVADGWGEKR